MAEQKELVRVVHYFNVKESGSTTPSTFFCAVFKLDAVIIIFGYPSLSSTSSRYTMRVTAIHPTRSLNWSPSPSTLSLGAKTQPNDILAFFGIIANLRENTHTGTKELYLTIKKKHIFVNQPQNALTRVLSNNHAVRWEGFSKRTLGRRIQKSQFKS